MNERLFLQKCQKNKWINDFLRQSPTWYVAQLPIARLLSSIWRYCSWGPRVPLVNHLRCLMPWSSLRSPGVSGLSRNNFLKRNRTMKTELKNHPTHCRLTVEEIDIIPFDVIFFFENINWKQLSKSEMAEMTSMNLDPLKLQYSKLVTMSRRAPFRHLPRRTNSGSWLKLQPTGWLGCLGMGPTLSTHLKVMR